MQRRDLLAGCALGLSIPLAGCPGGDSSGEGPTNTRPPPPRVDRAPEELLPSAPSGWTLIEQGGDPDTLAVGAEAGARAVYRSPDEADYSVRVYRWDSNGAARNGFDEFENWIAYVVLGNFSFLVRGPSVDDAFEILGATPAFSEEFARANNMFE